MKKYHFVYKTTNNVNGKIYIGMHSANSLSDTYLGSGFALKHAIKKHGKYMFTREILSLHASREEARVEEARIVTPEFVLDNTNYNLTEGGGGCMNQEGEKNHQYGKVGIGNKPLLATHKSGQHITAQSINELSEIIGIARGNIRNLINKGITGKRGWSVSLIQDIV